MKTYQYETDGTNGDWIEIPIIKETPKFIHVMANVCHEDEVYIINKNGNNEINGNGQHGGLHFIAKDTGRAQIWGYPKNRHLMNNIEDWVELFEIEV